LFKHLETANLPQHLVNKKDLTKKLNKMFPPRAGVSEKLPENKLPKKLPRKTDTHRGILAQ